MNRVVLLLAVTALTGVGPLSGQDASLLVGGVHARYADSVRGTAGVISARFGATAKRSAGVVDASFSRFRTGETAIQFGGQGVHAWPISRAVSIGAVGLGTFGAFDGGNQSGIVSIGPAMLVGSGRVGGSIRLGAGAVRRVDGVGLSLLSADARFDARATSGVLLSLRTSANRADTIRFVDVGADVTLSHGIARLESGLGMRAGHLGDNPEWHVRLSLRAAPAAVIEAAAGAYPRDLSGFNSGGFATVGLRVGVPARAPAALRRVAALAVQRLSGGRVKLSVSVPEAQAVAIAGEWNAWTPSALARDGRRWTTELGLRPGVYRFALLVNGQRWTVPDDVAAIPDDFGGKAGLLVVP